MGIFQRIARLITVWAMSREPDVYIGGWENPYLLRHYVLGGYMGKDGLLKSKTFLGLIRIYVHEFKRSDDDRAHHDHPAGSISIGLGGRAVEHTIAVGGIHHRRELRAGQIRCRSSKFAHRIELIPGERYFTMFIFFRNVREWGFHCPKGWVHWKDFTAPEDRGSVGIGCD
jgi:hypothetical protein